MTEAIRSDAPIGERYDHLAAQTERLAKWIMANRSDAIKNEGACDTAIRLLAEYKRDSDKLAQWMLDNHVTTIQEGESVTDMTIRLLSHFKQMDDGLSQVIGTLEEALEKRKAQEATKRDTSWADGLKVADAMNPDVGWG